MKYSATPTERSRIFWGCFFAMVTCAFGFIVRTQVIGAWQVQFNLSETEMGEILGVGFWPFAFSIILLSLVIDRVGYGRTAAFGFLLHLVSTAVLLTAHTARALYWGTFIFALSNGTVEAYINCTVASMFPNSKTRWLNLLHAGWPGGMVLAGVLAIAMSSLDWHWRIGLTLLPTAAYAALLWGRRFPVSERVAAGVPYREMLKDFGALGTFVATYLIALQVCEGILGIQDHRFLWPLLPAAILAAAFGLYVRSLGRWLYFALLLVMIPLATTELGIDSWITDLMGPQMGKVGLNAGWVLVYTAAIMTVLRSSAGPLIRRLSPPGLLACGAAVAAAGLWNLSMAAGIMVLVGATVYGLGKAFFWPTMLGTVSEQCPRGGALTLNCIGGVGMLGLSVGMVFLGNVQDRRIDSALSAYDAAHGTALHATYLTEHKTSIFGSYLALNQSRLKTAPAADLQGIAMAQDAAKAAALKAAVYLPLAALAVFLVLLVRFRMRGGYRAAPIGGPAEPEVAAAAPAG